MPQKSHGFRGGRISECDCADTRYYTQSVGPAGLADDNRHAVDVKRAVQIAMPRIYNRMVREATTEFIWIVEDDVIPPPDAGERLMRGIDENVASVSGAYRSRYHSGWVAWDSGGSPIEKAEAVLAPIGGNGFGCVILRRSVLQQTVLQHVRPTPDYDPNFYHWLAVHTHFTACLDPTITCAHRGHSAEHDA